MLLIFFIFFFTSCRIRRSKKKLRFQTFALEGRGGRYCTITDNKTFIFLMLMAAEATFFRVDNALNISWPRAVPHVYLPDLPLMHTALDRMRTVPEEKATMRRFMHVFRTVCRVASGGVFVDSGANEGTWSLLAAAHGCTAIAIEPQPYCARLINSAAEHSGIAGRLQLHTKVYADVTISKTSPMSPRPCVPLDTCRGTASYSKGVVSDIRDTRFSVRRHTECLVVPFVTLDGLLPAGGNATPSVELWHLDVEGAELAALRSARRLLAERRIRRVMMEVDSMQRWRLNVASRMTIDETLAEVRAIFEGWRCTTACDGSAYAFPSHFRWGGPAQCPNVYCVAPGVDLQGV